MLVVLLVLLMLIIIVFTFKQKIIGQIENDGTKDVELTVSLKYLSNFWRTLEIPLINCEVNLSLTWSANCLIIADAVDNQVPTLTITDTKLYVSVLNLLTQDNATLLEQLKPGFERITN